MVRNCSFVVSFAMVATISKQSSSVREGPEIYSPLVSISEGNQAFQAHAGKSDASGVGTSGTSLCADRLATAAGGAEGLTDATSKVWPDGAMASTNNVIDVRGIDTL
jgi:hypothetical protein